VVALASAVIGLPRWARRRAEQMEAIAARSTNLAPPDLALFRP
jgi:hypothetical protein